VQQSLPWRAILYMSRRASTGFRTFQVFPKDLPSRSVARWSCGDRSVYDRRRSTMNEQAVQQRRGQGLNIAEVTFYSVLVLVIMFLSVYVPA